MENTFSPGVEVSDAGALVKNPTVSVCMITYNHASYLPAAVEGVLRQQSPYPLELIIGEDCSKDETRRIALDYQRRYPSTIRVMAYPRNVGMLANHRTAVLAARGKYVAFCEGDDFWHRQDKLAKQIIVLENEPGTAMVCADYRVVAHDGELVNESRLSGRAGYADYLSYEDLVLDRVYVPTLTVCARRDLIHSVLRESPQCSDPSFLMGDLPLWLELAQKGRIRYLPEPLASYRLSLNSATRQEDPLSLTRFEMNACEISYQFLAKYPLPGGEADTRNSQARFARAQLEGAALLGLRGVAMRQRTRFRQLRVSMGLRNWVLYGLAHTPGPRRRLVRAVRAMQRVWLEHVRSTKAGALLKALSGHQ